MRNYPYLGRNTNNYGLENALLRLQFIKNVICRNNAFQT